MIFGAHVVISSKDAEADLPGGGHVGIYQPKHPPGTWHAATRLSAYPRISRKRARPRRQARTKSGAPKETILELSLAILSRI